MEKDGNLVRWNFCNLLAAINKESVSFRWGGCLFQNEPETYTSNFFNEDGWGYVT